jgi:hypothetical protein
MAQPPHQGFIPQNRGHLMSLLPGWHPTTQSQHVPCDPFSTLTCIEHSMNACWCAEQVWCLKRLYRTHAFGDAKGSPKWIQLVLHSPFCKYFNHVLLHKSLGTSFREFIVWLLTVHRSFPISVLKSAWKSETMFKKYCRPSMISNQIYWAWVILTKTMEICCTKSCATVIGVKLLASTISIGDVLTLRPWISCFP